jgi:hypothetical protein
MRLSSQSLSSYRHDERYKLITSARREGFANLARVEAAAIVPEGPGTGRLGRAGAVETHERHPVDARPLHPGSAVVSFPAGRVPASGGRDVDVVKVACPR